MAASYIKKKITGNFLPTAVGGSSSTFVTDAGWSATGSMIMIFGGDASGNFGGLYAGGFSIYEAFSAVGSFENISAGLSR